MADHMAPKPQARKYKKAPKTSRDRTGTRNTMALDLIVVAVVLIILGILNITVAFVASIIFLVIEIIRTGIYQRRCKEYEVRIDEMQTPEMQDIDKARMYLRQLEQEIDAANKELTTTQNSLQSATSQLSQKRAQLIDIDSDLMAQDYGLYVPKFQFANSSQYKDKIDSVRAQEKALIKKFNESLKKTTWTVNGSKAEGKKMVGDIGHLLMRAFNGESDELIRKVKYTNVDRSREAIRRSADAVNKYGRVLGISIPDKYIQYKLLEVQLAFEYAQQKELEKDELREERERQREEAKVAKELEAKRKSLEKEYDHYEQAYEDAVIKLSKAEGQSAIDLEERVNELGDKLNSIKADIESVDYREANKKAGYIYIISNIGSFGPDVYKIGMTRRLEPMERIRELGDASVPFGFDTHALIFSDDAPGLEATLHKAFESKKLNLVNHRREFFKVSLKEIEDVILRYHDKTVEFQETPDADQYRISEQLRHEGKF